eukprot:UN01681
MATFKSVVVEANESHLINVPTLYFSLIVSTRGLYATPRYNVFHSNGNLLKPESNGPQNGAYSACLCRKLLFKSP